MPSDHETVLHRVHALRPRLSVHHRPRQRVLPRDHLEVLEVGHIQSVHSGHSHPAIPSVAVLRVQAVIITVAVPISAVTASSMIFGPPIMTRSVIDAV